MLNKDTIFTRDTLFCSTNCPQNSSILYKAKFALLLLSTTLLSSTAVAQHTNEQARVISAGAGMTELVLALNAGDDLVAVDSTSLVPESLGSVEQLGYHRMLSAEGVLAQNPTLIVGTPAMGPKTTMDVVKGAGVKIITLPDAQSEQQLMDNIAKLGDALNRNSQAQSLQSELKERLSDIETKRSGLAQKPKILFMLLQSDRPARIGGQGTAADIIINLAGGQNIADFDGYKSVSQEGILALQPDLILLSNRSNTPLDEQSIKVQLKNMPLLQHTPAGANKRLYPLTAQALVGGLGLSAIAAADTLADELVEISTQNMPQ